MTAMLAAIILAVGTPPGGADEILRPAAKWVVDYADNTCNVSREMGTDGDSVTLGFRVIPRSANQEMVLIFDGRPAHGPDFAQTTADFFIDGMPLTSGSVSRYRLATNRQVVMTTLSSDEMQHVADASSLGFAIKGGRTGTLATGPFAPVFAATEACKADLLRAWKLDPAVIARAVTPARPIGHQSDWFRFNDYPSGARAKGERGLVIARATIGVDGSVQDCGTVVTSQSAELDATTCRLLKQRGRFTPARDVSGAAVPDVAVFRVRWEI